jgi:hypothetical protein
VGGDCQVMEWRDGRCCADSVPSPRCCNDLGRSRGRPPSEQWRCSIASTYAVVCPCRSWHLDQAQRRWDCRCLILSRCAMRMIHGRSGTSPWARHCASSSHRPVVPESAARTAYKPGIASESWPDAEGAGTVTVDRPAGSLFRIFSVSSANPKRAFTRAMRSSSRSR